MRAIAVRPLFLRVVAAVVVGLSCGASLAQVPSATVAVKRLLALPAEDVGTPAPPPTGAALEAAEVATLPLRLHFGMTPEEVNSRLHHPLPSVAPASLVVVPYLGPDKVVSFSVPMSDAGVGKPEIKGCFAPNSQIVFQFVADKLYAVSFRFAKDKDCPNAANAADDLYERLLTIPYAAMPSQHYRVGSIEVVDAWNKAVSSVVRQRWSAQ